LMSTLINAPEDARLALLRSVRRHLAPNGVALIERYDPEIGNDPTPTERHLGAVTIRVSEISRDADRIYQTIDYDGGTHGHWQIRIEGGQALRRRHAMALVGRDAHQRRGHDAAADGRRPGRRDLLLGAACRRGGAVGGRPREDRSPCVLERQDPPHGR